MNKEMLEYIRGYYASIGYSNEKVVELTEQLYDKIKDYCMVTADEVFKDEYDKAPLGLIVVINIIQAGLRTVIADMLANA